MWEKLTPREAFYCLVIFFAFMWFLAYSLEQTYADKCNATIHTSSSEC